MAMKVVLLLLAALVGCGDTTIPSEDVKTDCIPTWSCFELECGQHPDGCGGIQDCGSCTLSDATDGAAGYHCLWKLWQRGVFVAHWHNNVWVGGWVNPVKVDPNSSALY